MKKKMYKVKKEATIWLIAIFLLSMGIANAQTNDYSMMDSDVRNPGNDKQCLKYEDCPVWDGNPDTKVYYDLMKLDNGTGVIAKSDFNWNVHLYTCHQNKLLDSINGEGAFERLATISAKDGMIPCPINVNNPHWSYDWESHIIDQKSRQVDRKPGPQQGLKNSI